MANNLCIDLRPRQDGNGNTYYVGKLEFPGTIDCSKGIAFLIFTSEDGSEQMQITSIDKKESK